VNWPAFTWWLLSFLGDGICMVGYLSFTSSLRISHALRGAMLRKHAGHGHPIPAIPAAAFLHWCRRELRWIGLAAGLLGDAAQALTQRAQHVGGWSAEETGFAVAVVVGWLSVQRWQDNRDCTCDDHEQRKRRRTTVVSRIIEGAGRLVAMPVPVRQR